VEILDLPAMRRLGHFQPLSLTPIPAYRAAALN
jgi:hypothetical protein